MGLNRAQSVALRGNRILLIITVSAGVMLAAVGVASALILKALVDTALGGDLPDLYGLLLVSAGYMVIYVAVSFMTARLANLFVTRAVTSLRRALVISAMGKVDVLREGDASSGYLGLVLRELDVVERDYLRNSVAAPRNAFTLVLGVTVMVILDPLVSLAILVAVVIAAAVMGATNRGADGREQDVATASVLFTHGLKDFASGLYTIRAYQGQRGVAQRLLMGSEELTRAKHAAYAGRDRIRIVAELCTYFVVLVMFAVSVAQAILGNTSVGTLVAFVQLLNYVVLPMQSLPQEIDGLRTARASLARIGLGIDLNADADPALGVDTRPAQVGAGGCTIDLAAVTYRYPGSARRALCDVSFQFRANQSYAVVGASGSGKSTLLKLLQGFDPDYTGSIRIAGKELRGMPVDELAQRLGIVHQEVYVFDASLRDNVTVFLPYPDEAVLAAVHAAGLRPVVDRLGLDHACGEHGGTLSGGERQRVGIARAFLRNSPVLLFDEITSALDRDTARSIEAVVAARHDATRIVVTHRIEEESMRRFDAIVVLEQGRLVDAGSFDELADREGPFSTMLRTGGDPCAEPDRALVSVPASDPTPPPERAAARRRFEQDDR